MANKKITGVIYAPTIVNELTIKKLDELRKASMVKNGTPFHQHYLISPEAAQYMLDNYNMNNRSINRSTVVGHITTIRNNDWNKQSFDPLTFDWEGNFINGQHRLMAIIETGTTQEMVVRFGVNPNNKLTEGTNRVKSTADTIAMNNDSYGGEYRTDRAAVARLIHGFKYDHSRPHVYALNYKPTNLVLGRINTEFNDQIYKACQLAKSCRIKDIVAPSLAAFVHFLISNTEHGDKAEQFIRDMASGVNMDANDPRLVARNRLIAGKREFSNNRDMAIAIMIEAWNGWIDGKKATSRRQRPSAIARINGLAALGKHKLYVNV